MVTSSLKAGFLSRRMALLLGVIAPVDRQRYGPDRPGQRLSLVQCPDYRHRQGSDARSLPYPLIFHEPGLQNGELVRLQTLQDRIVATPAPWPGIFLALDELGEAGILV